jgi:hypothetical protein
VTEVVEKFIDIMRLFNYLNEYMTKL